MQILKHGNTYMQDKMFLCICGCKFIANFKEYRKVTPYGKPRTCTYFSCECPECGKEVLLEETSSEKVTVT